MAGGGLREEDSGTVREKQKWSVVEKDGEMRGMVREREKEREKEQVNKGEGETEAACYKSKGMKENEAKG